MASSPDVLFVMVALVDTESGDCDGGGEEGMSSGRVVQKSLGNACI